MPFPAHSEATIMESRDWNGELLSVSAEDLAELLEFWDGGDAFLPGSDSKFPSLSPVGGHAVSASELSESRVIQTAPATPLPLCQIEDARSHGS